MNSKKYSNDVKISKTISWLLRHNAIQEGLAITDDGYVVVDELLSHKSLRRLNTKLEDIQRIVENDAKQRYKLNISTVTGKLEIKANQGHSMVAINNSDLKKIIDPQEVSHVIHGTYYRNLESIKSEGLKIMNRIHIHFTDSENLRKNQSGFRNNCEILIYINLQKAIIDGIEFFKSENNVILSSGINGCIRPEYFLKIVDRNTKKTL